MDARPERKRQRLIGEIELAALYLQAPDTRLEGRGCRRVRRCLCTPPWSATGPWKTHAGRGAAHRALPASIAASVGSRPTAPTRAESTMSAPLAAALIDGRNRLEKASSALRDIDNRLKEGRNGAKGAVRATT